MTDRCWRRIPVSAFLEAIKLGGTLEKLVRRYSAFSLRYASQTIACSLLHSVKQRMCRWLLMCCDRVAKEEFTLTHEFLSEMLGVSPSDRNGHRRDTAKGEPHHLSPRRHPYSQSEKDGRRQLRMLRGHQGVI
jgi:hypothetical protein